MVRFPQLVLLLVLLATSVSSLGGSANDTSELCSNQETVAASTESAASLMQATSARSRLKDGVSAPQDERRDQILVSSENSADREVLPLSSKAPLLKEGSQHNVSSAQTSSGEDGQEHQAPCLLHKSMAVATSLLQRSHALGLRALDYLSPALPLRQAALASTGALILVFCLLAILGASAFFAMVSISSNNEPHLPPELLARANSGMDSQLYLPMTASPPPSLRSTRTSPEVSQKRLQPSASPEATGKLSTASFRQARGQQELPTNDSLDSERAPRKTTASELHFCPDLVVPQHCECILVLPRDLGDARSSFTIMDVNGSPVLRAVPELPADGRPWRATVTTSTGESLVTCCETRSQSSDAEFQLMRANGQIFGKLAHSPSQDRYLLTIQSGTVLHFWGNFANSAVNITDDGNRLLATTEIGNADFDKEGTYCRLRVAPLADVGLALCGLLCISQHLNRC